MNMNLVGAAGQAWTVSGGPGSLLVQISAAGSGALGCCIGCGPCAGSLTCWGCGVAGGSSAQTTTYFGVSAGSVVMAVAILLESALAFLRLSDPNVASWGNLIGLGRDVLRVQWYVSAIPGIAILVTVLAVSLVGQGLNDALNPRLKGR
jgi:hypothetical protein